jgi:murein DD-endopeptidase MepM/ murein hydrolase activator NlpD
MKLRYILSFAIILSFVFIQKVSFVSAVSQSEINSKNAQIKQLEKQIQDIQNKKNQTAQQKSSKEAEVNNLKQQINNINSDIKKLQGQLVEVGQKINETDNNIQQTTKNIQELEAEISSNKDTIKSLVESLYKSSLVRNEVVAVVSADKLSDVFSFIEYSNTVQMKIQTLLDEVIEKKTSLDITNQNLANQKATLASTQGALEDTKESIENSKNSVQNKAKASEITVNQLSASLNSLNSQQKSLEERRKSTAVELANAEAALLRQFGRGGGTVCSARGYAWPVQGGRITQGFGMTPFAKSGAYRGAGHNGIDIGAPTGTPVYATSSGSIVSVGFNDDSYGKWVVIKHTDGYFSLYGHLSQQRVSNGQTVNRGDRIGDIGDTGFATGPHLHFTIYLPNSLRVGSSPKGAAVNPSTCGY